MKLILDASVSLRWVLPDSQSAAALKLRVEFQNQVHDLLAPDGFIGENANGLIKAERQKLIDLGSAAIHHADVMSTPPKFFSFPPFVPRAIMIASQTRAGFYDCLYVALAESENCELVTADQRLIRNLQAFFPFIRSLASMP